jgi:MinD-like ATPase involved in chromosome partitioning or flagellar assembly
MESEFISLDKGGQIVERLWNCLEDILCWPKSVPIIYVLATSLELKAIYNAQSRHIHHRYKDIKYLFSNEIIFIDYGNPK